MREQAYDVSVELTVPRSPPNLEKGNFMVALFALRSQPENPAFSLSPSAAELSADDLYRHVRQPGNVAFAARRPTLIPYADPLVSTTSRVLLLLYYVLYPAASERTTLVVPMGELVEFRNALPLSLLVDVQAGQTLQVYEARVTLVARLSGVRWAMFHHRVISFAVGTAIFWVGEMLSMLLAWLLLGRWLSGPRPGQLGGGGGGGSDIDTDDDNDDYEKYDPWPVAPPPPLSPEEAAAASAFFRGGVEQTEGRQRGEGAEAEAESEADPGVKKEEEEDEGEDEKDSGGKGKGKGKREAEEQRSQTQAVDYVKTEDDEEELGVGTSLSHRQEKGSLRKRPSWGSQS
ncbi:putative adipose-regulatory protein-domain-containing protein [Durotheca rogersii]|uniref:putative adipose-regulatory protein-domain-containing protein n=1 Tax=Durotheca rogersii TaxID=419775 RepID=UPI00221E39C1|nr:putative adipose-regulatory protein-domain-containing protein [Durotheca rogersii]KAI5866383.1 putative adipose-regulatory protein-domain-containing protein [Durotheca rogersii]